MPPPAEFPSPERQKSDAASAHHIKVTSQQALEAAGIGTWSWQIGSDVVVWDAFTHKIFGLDSPGFSAPWAAVEQRIHPDDQELVHLQVAHCLESGSSFDCEFRITTERSARFLCAKGQIYRDDQGVAVGITGACWDITERKTMEDELAHERFLLRTLMESIPDKIYFKDKESRFIRVSHMVLERFDTQRPEDVIGKTDFHFFSAEHARQAFEDEQKIIQTGQPIINLEEKETWSDGRETWVSTTKLPIYDPSGAIIGTFGVSRDITARRRAETQLAKYTEELRRRNTELEEDLEMARELQSALMPKNYPAFPPGAQPQESALRFSHFFNPSMTVSGDFFDILELSDTMAGVFICDVMGHGMRAALVAAIVRALVGELKGSAKTPGEFLGRLNRKLFGILNETEITMFASAVYLTIDTVKGELRYANAGHPDPLWIRHEGADDRVSPLNHCKRGPVLGIFEDTHYATSKISLSPQDMVLMFTDGLFEVEGANGEFYDERCLMGAVNRRTGLTAANLCQEVLEEVQQFSADKHFNDDVCLVAFEIQHLA